MVDRTFVEGELAKLKQQQDQTFANLHALGGAIKAFEIILAEFDKGEVTPPPASLEA